ncbi:hypothetical protein V2J31_15890 [Bacillus safensis]|uniref:hypothetical protein n=1 Tax=Bacillus safensis TaxID=561879 RepID=UPI002E995BE0|nr:hypothetical protein [Bacillus safensis]
MSEFNTVASIKAQSEYCKREGAPHFAPMSGICWNCRSNIYEKRQWKFEMGRKIPASKEEATMTTGIPLDEATNHLVTGCPHCNRSYCD